MARQDLHMQLPLRFEAIGLKATKAMQLVDTSPVVNRHTTRNMMDLPDHVLVNVLKHLPLVERLSSCSLVNKRFRHAAAAATTASKLSVAAVNHGSFNCWIKQHGQHVSSLKVAPTAADGAHCNHAWPLPTQVLQQLPNLKVVHLSSYTNVHDAFWQHLPTMPHLEDLSASIYHKTDPRTVSAALVQLRPLKRLSLDARTFTLTTETSPELQQLTGLEQLCLTAKALQPELLQGLTRLVDLRFDAAVYEGRCSALLSAVAPLTELTRLELRIQYVRGHDSYWPPGADANYAAFTSSNKLQHLGLRLHLPQSAWSAVFHAGLQLPDLKVLKVDTCADYIRFGHSETPGLSQLVQLQTFCLCGGQLDARVPAAVPKLHKLQLNRVNYFDHSIPRHENIVIPFEIVGEELLRNISQLKQLVYLEEDSIQRQHEYEYAAPGWSDLGPKEFTEQRLQHIQQGMSMHHGKIWQLAVREQLLPYLSGKPCQADSLIASALCQLMFVDSSNMSAVNIGPCTAAQLRDLVQKYPNLRSCAISLDRSASVDLSVLAQLRGLTELAISNVDPAAMGVLAEACSKIKTLCELHLWQQGSRAAPAVRCRDCFLTPLAKVSVTQPSTSSLCGTHWGSNARVGLTTKQLPPVAFAPGRTAWLRTATPEDSRANDCTTDSSAVNMMASVADGTAPGDLPYAVYCTSPSCWHCDCISVTAGVGTVTWLGESPLVGMLLHTDGMQLTIIATVPL